MITETATKGKSNRKSVLPAVLSAGASLLAISLSATPASANNATLFSPGTSETLSGIIYKKKDDDYYDFCNPIGATNFSTISNSNHINGFATETIGANSIILDVVIEPSEQEQNLYNYIACYIDQIGKNPSYITISSSDAFTFFYKSALKLSKIPFQKAKVHLLPDNGIKYILKLNDTLLLQVSQSMVEDGLSASQVVFSLFENKELIQSNISNIDVFVEKVQAFFIA